MHAYERERERVISNYENLRDDIGLAERLEEKAEDASDGDESGNLEEEEREGEI